MAEIIEPRLGIDRCDSPLHISFALTLMEQGKFEWRGNTSHEWEVGRWPGLGLTLLAQPEWGPHQPHFAICPLPGNAPDVPFIVFLALGGSIERSCLDSGDASITLFYLSIEQVRRDMAACAHRAFDLAVSLQRRHLHSRFSRFHRGALPNLPAMKSLMTLQYPFTAPMYGFEPPAALTD